MQEIMKPEFNVLEFLKDVMSCDNSIDINNTLIFTIGNLSWDQDYCKEIVENGYIDFLERFIEKNSKLRIAHIRDITWGIVNLSNLEFRHRDLRIIITILNQILNVKDLTWTVHWLNSIEMLAWNHKIADELLELRTHSIIFDLISDDQKEDLWYSAISAASELVCNSNLDFIEKVVDDQLIKQLSRIYNWFIPKDSMWDISIPSNHYAALSILKLISWAVNVSPKISRIVFETNLFELVLEDLMSETTSIFVTLALHFLWDWFSNLEDEEIKQDVVTKVR